MTVAVRGTSHEARAQRAAWIAGGATFAGLALLTTAIVTIHPLRFAWRAPRARLPLETVGATVAALTAAVLWMRYSVGGAVGMLLIGLAFAVIATTHVVFGILLPPGTHGVGPGTAIFFWSWGRFLAAVLLLIGALPVLTGMLRSARRRRAAVMLAVVVAVAGESILYLARDHLPALTNTPGRLNLTFGGALPRLTAADLVIGSICAAMFLAVAVAYVRTPIPDLPRVLVAPAFVVAAFAHIHHMLFPTIYGAQITTGDLLRATFVAVVFVAVIGAFRRSYQAEHERSLQLEESDRVRTGMLRILSHELAHPVATLRTYVIGLLQRRENLDVDTQNRALMAMEMESRNLRDLSQQLDAVAQLDREQFHVRPRRTRVSQLLQTATASEAVAEGNGVVVKPIDPSNDVVVLADGLRIAQVFHNLLSNAEKYGGEQHVEVRTTVRDDDVMFTVADRGPGISHEDIPRLFEWFSRLSNSAEIRGSGLGLYICRRIIEGHGGTIWVESDEQQGAAFSFTVPRAGVR